MSFEWLRTAEGELIGLQVFFRAAWIARAIDRLLTLQRATRAQSDRRYRQQFLRRAPTRNVIRFPVMMVPDEAWRICEGCRTEPAIVYCQEHATFLCENCIESHQQQRTTRCGAFLSVTCMKAFAEAQA